MFGKCDLCAKSGSRGLLYVFGFVGGGASEELGKFAVGVRSGGLFEMGQWDTKGEWRGYGSDYLAHEWRSEVWGLVGVHRGASGCLREFRGV